MIVNYLKFEVYLSPRETEEGTKYAVVFSTPTDTIVSKEMTEVEAYSLHEEIRNRIIKSGVSTIGAYNSCLSA